MSDMTRDEAWAREVLAEHARNPVGGASAVATSAILAAYRQGLEDAAVLGDQREANLTALLELALECLSEVKATNDGESEQPIGVIVDHFLTTCGPLWDRQRAAPAIRALGEKSR